MLEKVFIKNYKDVKNEKVRKAYGIMCSTIGIVSNILLSIAKLIIGFISGSISIIADGIDNLSDSASSVVTLIGFKLASLPADSEHPFGHERIEYISGMIVSILILLIGVMLGRTSIENIINSSTINIDNFVVLISVLSGSILIKLFQFIFYKRTAKKIDSSAIEATAQDSLNDCIKTFVVIISIVIFKIWGTNLDAWFGLGVSIYIVINGISLIKQASSPLIGESPKKSYTQAIVSKLQSYDGVLGIHDLLIHNYGPDKTFITVHVEVDSNEDLLTSHDMIDNIERDFKEQYGVLMTIHLDPIQTHDELTNKLKEAVLEVLLNISSQISFHDFRIVKGTTHINVLFDVVVPQKFAIEDEVLKQLIINEVKEKCEKITGTIIHVILNIDKDYI